MSRFVGFFGDFRDPALRAWLGRLAGGFLRCRMRFVMDGNLALCLTDNTSTDISSTATWRGLAGDFHLERRVGKAAGKGSRVWLRYEPEVGQLTLGRSLDATETVYFTQRARPNVTIFSNALNPVLQLAGRKPALSETGLLFYLALSGIPAPWTAFHEVWKVGPGRAVEIGLNGRVYSSVPGAGLPRAALRKIQPELVREELKSAVASLQEPGMRDGILLSGGVDSTIVAKLVCANRTNHPPAFTLRYGGNHELEGLNWDYPYAREVAGVLHLDLREVRLDARIPGWAIAGYLLRYCDEPVADPAMVPLFLMASRAKSDGIEHLWDGRGGDDLLSISVSRWRVAAWCLGWRTPFSHLRSVYGAILKNRRARGQQYRKWLASDVAESALWRSALLGPDEIGALLHDADWDLLLNYFRGLWERSGEECPAGIAQRADWETWFAEQNQRMADALAKLVGVEFLSPLASESFTRLTFSATFTGRVPGFGDKALLRDAFRKDLPRAVRRRPKRGLATPVRRWIEMGKPFAQCYVEKLRESFRDGPLRWDVVERWLRHPDADPVMQWRLLSLVLWLHAQVGEIPSVEALRPETERQPQVEEV